MTHRGTVAVSHSTASERAQKLASIASEAKAEDVVILDLRGLSSITDFFVVLTGTSQTHLRSLGKRIEDEMLKLGLKPSNVEGNRGTGWMVFDYGSVIVHAMTHDSRRLYELERLWGDAPKQVWE
ncbi:MAG: ribosome silencing factor [Candidatus Sumerlaeaceae bacterium]